MGTDDGSYRVDLEHLDQFTARIAGLYGFVQDSLSGLDQRVTAAHQQWSGAAADRHADAHREWMTAAGEAQDGIYAMRKAAAAAHDSYTAVIAANRKLLGR
jgi:WXG100 family type VII secretion target